MSEGAAPRRPPRPALSTALWALIAACASERLALAHARTADAEGLRLALLCCAGLAAALVVACCRALCRPCPGAAQAALAVALAASLGALSAGHAGMSQRQAVLELSSSAISGWELTIVTDASSGPFGQRCRARGRREGGTKAELWLLADRLPERGTTIVCVGSYKPLSDDERGSSSWAQGICGSVRAARVLRSEGARGPLAALAGLRRRALAALDPEAGEGRALLAGCLCGSRPALYAWGIPNLFSRCGIAHLVAVSGTHLALVGALVASLLEGAGMRPRARLPLLAVVTGTFVAFCGAPVSALRAWLMTLVAFGSQLAGRRSHALSSVCVVALVMALARPSCSGELSFLLSVESVVGLCVLQPHARYLLEVLLPTPRPPRWAGTATGARLRTLADGLRQALAATLVCQLATLPTVAGAFGRLSLVAPVANLLVAPCLGALLALGVCLPPLGLWAPLAQAALVGADLGARAVLTALQLLARLPGSSCAIASRSGPLSAVAFAAAVGWLLWWPRVSRAQLLRTALVLALCGGALHLRWRLCAPARVVVLDVGQGDAVLVQDGAATLLVDTGPDGSVCEALARNHVSHLDAVLLTHLHDDHTAGLGELVGMVSCDRVLVARGVAGELDEGLARACRELSGEGPEELSYNDELRVGRFRLRMVWPQGSVDGHDNSDSIELALAYASGAERLSALLAGDAERDETGAVIAAGDIGDIDLLKLGHHGSEVSIDEGQAAVLRAEVAVASAGEHNPFGHPTPSCVSTMEAGGSLVLCTKDVGDVELRPGQSGPRVITRAPCLPASLE